MKKVFILVFVLLVSQVVFAQNGDVNGDGSVTSYDITALYNYLLNNDMTYYSTSDINSDGSITAADVTAVYDILLGVNSGGNPSVGGHEYVDLGLPSGTLWATMNIGANSPEEYGDYFAWGETAPKDVYEWSTYQWYYGYYDINGLHGGYTKYCTQSYYGWNGFVDNKTELDPEDDAATANWGSEWRMPSSDQMVELIAECTWQIITRNGVHGRLFTSRINGASLFLPAAGYRWDSSLYYVGELGYYWSRTLNGAPCSCYLFLRWDNVGCYSQLSRYGGFTVRAVRVP